MPIILILLGLCFGSFANALVWRLHAQPKAKSLKLKNKDLSILRGRSMCVHCHHTLSRYDLIPVVSWLSLGGKCRYCKKPISWQYPAVELATALLFVFSYLYWPYQLSTISYQLLFGLWLVVLVLFMALIVYDIKWMILPDKLVLITTILSGLIAIINIAANFHHPASIFQPFWGVLCIAGLFYVLFQVSKGKWIGGGDVKLGVSLGILVGGPANALLTIFLASVLGTICSFPLLLKNKKMLNKHIPFGPFLMAATVIVFLFGHDIILWYKNSILLMS